MNGTKLNIITSCRTFLYSWEANRGKYCRDKKCFTRQGKLGFVKTAVAVVYLLKKSLSLELNDMYAILEVEQEAQSTKSGFSQSRYKISYEFYEDWHQDLVYNFYTQGRSESTNGLMYPNLVKTWKGYVLQAVDGTSAYLFDKGNVKSYFGCHSNQHGVQVPMAQIVVRYDVLNHIAVSGLIESIRCSENSLAYKLLKGVSSNVISLYDRHFHSFAFIYAHMRRDLPFVMRARCSEKWLKDFLATGLNEQIVSLKATKEMLKLVKNYENIDLDPLTTLSVRLIRVELDTGEVEVLITNLLDQTLFPWQDFKALYALRWAVETYFDVLKNTLQLEIFSGYCVQAIKQDFYALLILSSLYAIMKPQEEQLKPINERRTHNYALNKTVTLGLFKKIIPLIFCHKDFEQHIDNFNKKCLKFLEPIRLNRHFQRTKRKQRLTGKYKTLVNYKRAV
jgi:hypothetical protein